MMAEIYSLGNSLARSAKVQPIVSDETLIQSDDVQSKQVDDEQQHIINFLQETVPLEMQLQVTSMSVDGGEHNPHDAWLPITESRNGSTLSATFHLLSSGIGVQVLSLPLAFVSLGWLWGILSLSLLFSWQFYTIWLLVDLHESSPPPTGIRYSRFMHLSIVAFGEKLGKLLALFPTMYLSGGACVIYIITGGATMERLFDNLECTANSLTGAQWFLLFVSLAILTSLFIPNLNSVAYVSFIGSITALVYCSLIWILSITKGRPDGHVETQVVLTGTGDASQIRNALTGFGMIALAFRGHNLVLEIQGTLPSNRKHQSRKPMWRGVIVSYILIAMCMYPLAIVGYWAYGDKITGAGGIVVAFTEFHRNSTSKYLIGAIYLLIIISYVCAFQIYAMPTLDNFRRIYVAKKNGPCPRWVQSAIKLFFGGLTYLVSVAFPFLPSLATLIGAIALPLTLVYPCFMWIAIKKPQRFSRRWYLNMGLGASGVVLSLMLFATSLWSLIINGLKPNFFKPK